MYQVQNLISDLGIRSTLKGFHYLTRAVNFCFQDETYLSSICKRLYVDIASDFDTQPVNVDHCMRTAIDHCWNYGNKELLKKLANYDLKYKPTNSDFIDILYRYLVSQEHDSSNH